MQAFKCLQGFIKAFERSLKRLVNDFESLFEGQRTSKGLLKSLVVRHAKLKEAVRRATHEGLQQVRDCHIK